MWQPRVSLELWARHLRSASAPCARVTTTTTGRITLCFATAFLPPSAIPYFASQPPYNCCCTTHPANWLTRRRAWQPLAVRCMPLLCTHTCLPGRRLRVYAALSTTACCMSSAACFGRPWCTAIQAVYPFVLLPPHQLAQPTRRTRPHTWSSQFEYCGFVSTSRATVSPLFLARCGPAAELFSPLDQPVLLHPGKVLPPPLCVARIPHRR